MSDIMGSITTLKKFFSNEEVKIECWEKQGNPQVIFELEKDRRYIIPKYQREIRWKSENIIELMADIKKNHKFLGNIILSKTEGGYNIIDGQQRITSLLLLFEYIKTSYDNKIDVINTCELKIESFQGFEILFNNHFNIDDGIVQEIEITDDYNQMERYITLWNDIKNSGMLGNRHLAQDFLHNMEKCEINIIISKSSEYSIDYFLDVNLKGIKLDTEDIFKSYLLSLNKDDKIYKAWVELKKLSEKLKKKKAKYPLMKIIEHYFYCELYKNDEYKKIVFDEDFLLKEEYKIDDYSFYKGQHLLKVIGDYGYLLDSINNIINVLTYITAIISDGYGDSFKAFFNEKAKIDDVEKQIIYYIIKYLILDSNKIPKVLVMRYMLDICSNKEKATKKDYKMIYISYITAVCFNIFEGKKSSDILYDIVKSSKWYETAYIQLKDYFKSENYEDRKFDFICKYNPNGSTVDIQSFRCRSLACIYNYFIISQNVGIMNGKILSVKEFFNDNTKFSLEHFIINHSGKCNFTIDGKVSTYSYPEDIKKYTDYIANYIFIPEEINNKIGNLYINNKLEILETQYKSDITCNYSKMIMKIIKETFKFPKIEPNEEFDKIRDKLDIYYSTKFKNEYMIFLRTVIEEVYKAKFKG